MRILLWLNVLLLVWGLAQGPSVARADEPKAGSLIGRDWTKSCKDQGRGKPACRKDCTQNSATQSCNVYCPDGKNMGRCLVGVSCPGNTCSF